MTRPLAVSAASLAAIALAATLTLAGCSRLADPAGETSPSISSGAATTSSVPTAPDTGTLDSISSDLGAADTANTEAGSNASAGDQAAAQDDNG